MRARPAGRGHDDREAARRRLPGAARRGADVRRRARPVRHRGVLPEPDRGQGVPAHPARCAASRCARSAARCTSRSACTSVRRRGLSGELREIREHSHGDPFKFIAWKATARRRQADGARPRERDRDDPRPVLLDVGAGMRSGSLGRAPLDWACDAAAALGRRRDRQQRSRRPGRVRHPADRRAPARHGPPPLPAARRPPARHPRAWSTRTSPTSPAGELVALVARYLAHQEAIDVRIKLAPPLDDPRLDADPGRAPTASSTTSRPRAGCASA